MIESSNNSTLGFQSLIEEEGPDNVVSQTTQIAHQVLTEDPNNNRIEIGQRTPSLQGPSDEEAASSCNNPNPAVAKAEKPQSMRMVIPLTSASDDFVKELKIAFDELPRGYEKNQLMSVLSEEITENSLSQITGLLARLPEKNRDQIFKIILKKIVLDQIRNIGGQLSPSAKAKLTKSLLRNLEEMTPPPRCAKIGTALAYTSAIVGFMGGVATTITSSSAWIQSGSTCTGASFAAAWGCTGCAGTTAAVTTYVGCLLGGAALTAWAQDHTVLNDVEDHANAPEVDRHLSVRLTRMFRPESIRLMLSQEMAQTPSFVTDGEMRR